MQSYHRQLHPSNVFHSITSEARLICWYHGIFVARTTVADTASRSSRNTMLCPASIKTEEDPSAVEQYLKSSNSMKTADMESPLLPPLPATYGLKSTDKESCPSSSGSDWIVLHTDDVPLLVELMEIASLSCILKKSDSDMPRSSSNLRSLFREGTHDPFMINDEALPSLTGSASTGILASEHKNYSGIYV
jgi:hypothetical protein